MRDFTILKKFAKKTGIILFWLLIWQLISEMAGLEFLISSPVGAFRSLLELIVQKSYYIAVLNSFIRIISGFLLAFILGVVLGTWAGKHQLIYDFLSPIVYLCKALPMVAFIIFILICFGAKGVSTIISFIVVFPVIYISSNNGVRQVNEKLLEMAKVFRMSKGGKIRYLYIPSIAKAVSDNVSVALGMCWKAGVSAEVIGLVNNTIGTNMYYAKLYIMPNELIAWSVTVIVVSVLFEFLFMKIFRSVLAKIER